MSDQAHTNGTAKGISWILALAAALAALAASFAAVVMPIHQQVTTNKETLEHHATSESHVGTAEQLAAIKVQFAEVETQFRAERRVVEEWQRSSDEKHARYEQALVEVHNLRVDLERLKTMGGK